MEKHEHHSESNYIPWVIGGGALYLGYKFLSKKVFKPILKEKQMINDVTRMIITDKNVRLNGNKITVSFKINNPTNHAIIIRAIVGTITFLNNVPNQPSLVLADLDEFKGINVLPLHATPVELHFKVRQGNALLYSITTLLGKSTHTKVVFRGTINANGTPFPVVEQLQLT